jgi:hypothetical protein
MIGSLSHDRIDAAEAQWLAECIGRDVRFSDTEHRLLAFPGADRRPDRYPGLPRNERLICRQCEVPAAQGWIF